VLLGSGEFDWSDTRLTAAVLAVFVISLAAQAALLLIIRAFYAGGRTMLPLVYTAISSAVAVVLAYVGLWYWEQSTMLQAFIAGTFRLESVPGTEILVLAGAFACGQILQIILLLLQARYTFDLSIKPLGRLLLHAVTASAAGGMMAYAMLRFVVEGVNQDVFVGIALQGLVAGVAGVLTIVAVYYLLQTREFIETLRSFRKKIRPSDSVSAE
jgi:peptidoglycan biosynthesis protein MviN/MurJ (putative lipid II flippase)